MLTLTYNSHNSSKEHRIQKTSFVFNPSHPDPRQREKTNFKAFIKSFEAPQKSVKIKI